MHAYYVFFKSIKHSSPNDYLAFVAELNRNLINLIKLTELNRIYEGEKCVYRCRRHDTMSHFFQVF